MKTIIFKIILFLTISSIYAQEMSIMTYNIKLDYPKEGDDSWNNRKDWMLGQLKFYEPDIFGVQEAMPNQMVYLDSTLTNYAYVGVGRDGGDNPGEYSAIFYNHNDYKVLESSTFWLSETPDNISKGWDAALNRVCTYALFQDKNNLKFWVFNTHFDHVGTEARLKSVSLILDKMKSLNKENHPMLLMGDFNLEPETKNIALIKDVLNDSRDVSKIAPFGPEGTFNGFQFESPVTRRIDYIFVSKSGIEVKKYAVLSDSKNLRYPSDHFPVIIEITLTN